MSYDKEKYDDDHKGLMFLRNLEPSNQKVSASQEEYNKQLSKAIAQGIDQNLTDEFAKSKLFSFQEYKKLKRDNKTLKKGLNKIKNPLSSKLQISNLTKVKISKHSKGYSPKKERNL